MIACTPLDACPECGYLVGHTPAAARCPECGLPLGPHAILLRPQGLSLGLKLRFGVAFMLLWLLIPCLYFLLNILLPSGPTLIITLIPLIVGLFIGIKGLSTQLRKPRYWVLTAAGLVHRAAQTYECIPWPELAPWLKKDPGAWGLARNPLTPGPINLIVTNSPEYESARNALAQMIAVAKDNGDTEAALAKCHEALTTAIEERKQKQLEPPAARTFRRLLIVACFIAQPICLTLAPDSNTPLTIIMCLLMPALIWELRVQWRS